MYQRLLKSNLIKTVRSIDVVNFFNKLIISEKKIVTGIFLTEYKYYRKEKRLQYGLESIILTSIEWVVTGKAGYTLLQV